MATTAIGLPVLYQVTSGVYHAGVIAGNITNGGDTADLFVMADGSDWEDTMADKSMTDWMYFAKDKGAGVHEWQENAAGMGPPGESGFVSDVTPSTPARSLGTAFQPSSTEAVQASYSARVTASPTILSGALGRVELRSDASNPPTTVRARVAGGNSAALALGAVIVEAPLAYLVPAGHYVLLQSVNEVGTPSYSLTTQVEEILN